VADHAQVSPGTAGVLRVLVAPATAIVILAVALLLLMTPFWMHFAISAADSTQFGIHPLPFTLSDITVAELFFGPGTFSAFGADEAAHMRDVRVVLLLFLGLAAVSAVVLGVSIRRTSRDPGTWRSIARGGLALAVALVVLGSVAAFAFEATFELFHRIFFPGGNWAFPATSLLIRLYPYGFWELSSAALGLLGIGGGLIVWLLARRKARALESAARA
jgi:hypothetical protein